jgi:hypothetical protein
VARATDLHGRILVFLDHSRYYFFQAAPQLYPRGWVSYINISTRGQRVWRRMTVNSSAATAMDLQVQCEIVYPQGWVSYINISTRGQRVAPQLQQWTCRYSARSCTHPQGWVSYINISTRGQRVAPQLQQWTCRYSARSGRLAALLQANSPSKRRGSWTLKGICRATNRINERTTQSNPSNSVNENLTDAQLVGKLVAFKEPVDAQAPATGIQRYPEPNGSSPHSPRPVSIRYILI